MMNLYKRISPLFFHLGRAGFLAVGRPASLGDSGSRCFVHSNHYRFLQPRNSVLEVFVVTNLLVRTLPPKNAGTPRVVIEPCSKILFCMQQLQYTGINILGVLNYLDNFQQ